MFDVVFRRAQGALEFLTTYGWAFIVVLVMIGALTHFGVLNPGIFAENSCIGSLGFECKDSQVLTDGQSIKFSNKLGYSIQISDASVETNSGNASCTSSPGLVGPDQEFTLVCNKANLIDGEKTKLDISFNYYKPESGPAFAKRVESQVIAVVIPGSVSSSNGNDNESGEIGGSCPDGFVSISGSSYFGTSDFCVMKWEAKNNGSGVPVSAASGTPWVSISFTAAKNACASAGYHLITNREWMTIARSIENNPQNWNTGSVGSGWMSRGNSESSAAMDGMNSLSGINYRIFKVDGVEVWDLAGNVHEWVDLMEDDSEVYMNSICSNPSYLGFYSFNSSSQYYPVCIWHNGFAKIGAEDKRFEMGPIGNYDENQGVGSITSPNLIELNKMIRGGDWDSFVTAGIFRGGFNNPLPGNPSTGFRCVIQY